MYLVHNITLKMEVCTFLYPWKFVPFCILSSDPSKSSSPFTSEFQCDYFIEVSCPQLDLLFVYECVGFCILTYDN